MGLFPLAREHSTFSSHLEKMLWCGSLEEDSRFFCVVCFVGGEVSCGHKETSDESTGGGRPGIRHGADRQRLVIATRDRGRGHNQGRQPTISLRDRCKPSCAQLGWDWRLLRSGHKLLLKTCRDNPVQLLYCNQSYSVTLNTQYIRIVLRLWTFYDLRVLKPRVNFKDTPSINRLLPKLWNRNYPLLNSFPKLLRQPIGSMLYVFWISRASCILFKERKDNSCWQHISSSPTKSSLKNIVMGNYHVQANGTQSIIRQLGCSVSSPSKPTHVFWN